MPYSYQLQNRRRVRRALLTALALAGLVVLLVIAPVRIFGWSGLGVGRLTVPQAASVVTTAPVQKPAPIVRTPAGIAHLTFPAYAEWTDITEPCAECDWGWSYGVGSGLDPVADGALSQLEDSAGGATATGTRLSSNGPSGWSGGGAPTSVAGGIGAGGSGGSPSGASGAARDDPATESSETLESGRRGSSDPRWTVAGGAAGHDSGSAGSGPSSGGSDPSSGGSDPSAAGSDPSSAGSGPSTADGPNFDSPNLVVALALEPSGGANVLPLDAGDGVSPAREPTLPDAVVAALVESPAGTETVLSAGQPEMISDLVDLDQPAAAGDGGGQQAVAAPEPANLILIGLGLSAIVYRLRRAPR